MLQTIHTCRDINLSSNDVSVPFEKEGIQCAEVSEQFDQ